MARWAHCKGLIGFWKSLEHDINVEYKCNTNNLQTESVCRCMAMISTSHHMCFTAASWEYLVRLLKSRVEGEELYGSLGVSMLDLSHASLAFCSRSWVSIRVRLGISILPTKKSSGLCYCQILIGLEMFVAHSSDYMIKVCIYVHMNEKSPESRLPRTSARALMNMSHAFVELSFWCATLINSDRKIDIKALTRCVTTLRIIRRPRWKHWKYRATLLNMRSAWLREVDTYHSDHTDHSLALHWKAFQGLKPYLSIWDHSRTYWNGAQSGSMLPYWCWHSFYRGTSPDQDCWSTKWAFMARNGMAT